LRNIPILSNKRCPYPPRRIHSHPLHDTSSSPSDKDTPSHRPEKDKPTQQTPISRLEKGLPTFNLNTWKGNMETQINIKTVIKLRGMHQYM